MAEPPSPNTPSLGNLSRAMSSKRSADGKIESAFELSQLPGDLQVALGAFDIDNSGCITTSELLHAAEVYRKEKQTRKQLGRAVYALTGAVLLLLLANFGLTYAVVEISRQTDTATDGVTTVKDSSDVTHSGVVDARLITKDADAAKAASIAARDLDCLVPLERTNPTALDDPETAVEDGADNTWLFRFDYDEDDALPTAASLKAEAQRLCNALVKHNGACATGASDAAASTRTVSAVMTLEDVQAFRKDQRSGELDAGGSCDDAASPFGLEAITKDYKMSASPHWMGQHIDAHPQAHEMHMDMIKDVRRELHESEAGRNRLEHLRHARVLNELPTEAKAMLKKHTDRYAEGAKAKVEHKRALKALESAETPAEERAARKLLDAGFQAMKVAPAELNHCFFRSDLAASYTGETAITSKGLNCAPWDDVNYALNGVTLNSAGYPELAGNSCRNPVDALKWGKPWCFTVDEATGSLSAGTCEIDICEQSAFFTGNESVLKDDDWLWGVDRIDEAVDSELYDRSKQTWAAKDDGSALTGAGVHMFVFDSGVNHLHQEFGDRVVSRIDCTGKNADGSQADPDFTSASDGNGHGSHVAGIAAGSSVGVAPGVTIHALKTLNDNGSGDTGMTHACVKYVRENLAALTGGQPAVATMSLGGAFSQSANDMVDGLVDAGVFVSVAAGNQGADACTLSPSSAEKVFTVAATNFDDSKGTYSNWGSCIDMYAPGTAIKSADASTTDGYVTMGGTSMAAPFVAGTAALIFEAYPLATVEEINAYLSAAAFQNKVFAHDASDYGLEADASQQDEVDATSNMLLRIDDATWGAAKLMVAAKKAADAAAAEGKVDEEANAIVAGEIPQCEADVYTNMKWENDCPPAGTTVCGQSQDDYHVDAEGVGLMRPVRQGTAGCQPPIDASTGKPTCVCTASSIPVHLSCNTGNDYTYMPSCGLPTGIIQDTSALEGKKLTFTPRAGGDTFAVTSESLEYDGSAYLLPRSHQADQKYSTKLSSGNAVKVGMPKGLKMKFPNAKGKKKKVKALYVGANGFVAFAKVKKASLKPTIESHFDAKRSKGFSLSALYANLDISAGGEIYVGADKQAKAVYITWVQVPSVGPSGVSSYAGQNTFQVEINTKTGVTSVSYKSIVPALSGSAVVGVAFGQKKPSKLVDNADFHPYNFNAAPAAVN